MVNNNDIDLIIEKIKDIFYDEVCIKRDEELDVLELDEGMFFEKTNDYLKSFFNVNLKNKIIYRKKFPVELEDLFQHPLLSYDKVTSYVRNRGKHWDLLSIDDFDALPVNIKKNFDNDLYWSSTPYDHHSYWAFSFKTNKKVIVNRNNYCYVILKRC